MPRVSCPRCGRRGECRGTEEHFEFRGQHPHSRLPVRRCRSCGTGFTIRPRFFVLPMFGVKVQPIEPELWTRMGETWEREFGPADPTKQAECPVCGKAFATAAGRDDHLAAKHREAP